ncbi:hypothetical protein H5P28_09050 [Ruficoccus amylovorans]|uniref:Lipoprotein n=1 Tax=Ruficoccus amylovorans TaxID=1804625 RepID=A0A842HD97_9BACT|nr:hypothetical protein [Ruficoccus amylovorans]MBC2594402.1 hypothetical protein [Ruficoccus amylovorans]
MKFPSVFVAGLLCAGALWMSGCESPVSQGMSTSNKDFQNFMFGYEETTYEYPVQVPGTNRWVKIVSPEPIDHPLTYQDYLDWKAAQEAQEDKDSPAVSTGSKVNAPNRKQ